MGTLASLESHIYLYPYVAVVLARGSESAVVSDVVLQLEHEVLVKLDVRCDAVDGLGV